MKNRTTSQTTGPGKRQSATPPSKREIMQASKNKNRTTTNTTPGVKNPAVSSMELRSIMESAMREGAMQGVMGGAQTLVNQDYNNIPFKNNAIDILKRRKYDISSEFDGQEVQGTLTERPTLSGGRVYTERYDMPGGGSRMERIRYNQEGKLVNRTLKDKKINPR